MYTLCLYLVTTLTCLASDNANNEQEKSKGNEKTMRIVALYDWTVIFCQFNAKDLYIFNFNCRFFWTQRPLTLFYVYACWFQWQTNKKKNKIFNNLSKIATTASVSIKIDQFSLNVIQLFKVYYGYRDYWMRFRFLLRCYEIKKGIHIEYESEPFSVIEKLWNEYKIRVFCSPSFLVEESQSNWGIF